MRGTAIKSTTDVRNNVQTYSKLQGIVRPGELSTKKFDVLFRAHFCIEPLSNNFFLFALFGPLFSIFTWCFPLVPFFIIFFSCHTRFHILGFSLFSLCDDVFVQIQSALESSTTIPISFLLFPFWLASYKKSDQQLRCMHTHWEYFRATKTVSCHNLRLWSH